MGRSEQTAESLASLLDQLTHTGNGVIGADARQRIIVWNREAENLLGYTAAEVLGKPCYEVLKGRDCQGDLSCREHCAVWEQARQQHWSAHQMIQAQTKSRQPVWIHVITFGLQSPPPKLYALLHVFWRQRRRGNSRTLRSWQCPTALRIRRYSF